jgi:hypothetical protein
MIKQSKINIMPWINHNVYYDHAPFQETGVVHKYFDNQQLYDFTLKVMDESGTYCPDVIGYGIDVTNNKYYITMKHSGIDLDSLKMTSYALFTQIYNEALIKAKEYLIYLHGRGLYHGDLINNGMLHLGNTLYNEETGDIRFIDPMFSNHPKNELNAAITSNSVTPPTPLKPLNNNKKIKYRSRKVLFA